MYMLLCMQRPGCSLSVWAALSSLCQMVTGFCSARRRAAPQNAGLWWTAVPEHVPCGGRVLCSASESRTSGRETQFLRVSVYLEKQIKTRNVHSWIPPLKSVSAGPQRRRVEGEPEVKLRERKATPERRLTVSSSSLNHHHPSPCPPDHAHTFPSFHRPTSVPHRERLHDLLAVSQLLYKLPSRLLNGAEVTEEHKHSILYTRTPSADHTFNVELEL